MERRAERLREPVLNAETVVPCDAFEERIDEADQHERREQLRVELGALGDAARHDRGDRGGERQQEEKAHERIAVMLGERRGAVEKLHTVCDRVADEEVRDRRHREVHQNLDQCIDLVLLAHGAELQEGESCVHRQHHGGADQKKLGIGAVFQTFHRYVPLVPKKVRYASKKRAIVVLAASARCNRAPGWESGWFRAMRRPSVPCT
ncbi:hypothetical protein OKW49_003050 [Paraburkholderia youngii]